MQEEISKMSDEHLLEIYKAKKVLTKEGQLYTQTNRDYHIIRLELLKRLSKNNIEDKTLNKRPDWYNGTRQCIEANIDRPTPDSMNNIMAHIQTLVEFEVRDNIEEFKKKLIEEIKEYNLKVDNRTKMMSENVVEDLINNIGKE